MREAYSKKFKVKIVPKSEGSKRHEGLDSQCQHEKGGYGFGLGRQSQYTNQAFVWFVF